MLQQQHAEHDLSRRCFAATSLALLAAFGQLLLDDEQQGVILQRRIGVPHPGSPELMALAAGAFRPPRGVTDGAPEEGAAKDPCWGTEPGRYFISFAGGLL